MVIANKLDLIDEENRKTPIDQVNAFCTQNDLLYQECSAKLGQNVKESFEELIECIYDNRTKKYIKDRSKKEKTTLKIRIHKHIN